MIILLFVCIIGWTYESHINPDQFDNWKIVKFTIKSPVIVEIILDNPNQSSNIKRVTVFIDRERDLLGYNYVMNDIKYYYFFDNETECYKLIKQELVGDDI